MYYLSLLTYNVLECVHSNFSRDHWFWVKLFVLIMRKYCQICCVNNFHNIYIIFLSYLYKKLWSKFHIGGHAYVQNIIHLHTEGVYDHYSSYNITFVPTKVWPLESISKYKPNATTSVAQTFHMIRPIVCQRQQSLSFEICVFLIFCYRGSMINDSCIWVWIINIYFQL